VGRTLRNCSNMVGTVAQGDGVYRWLAWVLGAMVVPVALAQAPAPAVQAPVPATQAPAAATPSTAAAPVVNPAAFDAVPAKIGFDVVQFKRCPDGQYGDMKVDMPLDSDYIAYHCETVWRLIYFAYNGSVKSYSLVPGYPAWVDDDRYQFIAKVSPEDIPAWQKLDISGRRVLMRQVLADALKLKIHVDTTEQAIYALTVAKNGPKMTAYHAGDQVKLPNGQMQDKRAAADWLGMNVYFLGFTMGELASNLTSHLDRPVVNQTNLTGNFNLVLPITPGTGWDPNRGLGEDGVPLMDAVREFGLRLDASKAAVARLAIDHIEKPAED